MKNNEKFLEETPTFPITITNNVMIYETKLDASFAIGRSIIQSLKKNPKISLGLSAGNIFKDIYNFIAANYANSGTSFAEANIFSMTEFANMNNSQTSLSDWLYTNFLNQIDAVDKNTFIISNEKINEATNFNVVDFNKELVKHAPIDIELLHLGVNGSIAFNEPSNNPKVINNLTGLSVLSNSSLKELSTYVRNNQCPRESLTMGILEIINASKIIIPAYGPAMVTPIVKLLRAIKYDPMWPITALVYAQCEVKIYLDKATYDLIVEALKK